MYAMTRIIIGLAIRVSITSCKVVLNPTHYVANVVFLYDDLIMNLLFFDIF
jgi:hypothetical protein